MTELVPLSRPQPPCTVRRSRWLSSSTLPHLQRKLCGGDGLLCHGPRRHDRKMTFRDMGMEVDGIMHAALSTPPVSTSLPATPPRAWGWTSPGNTLQISISGDEYDALHGYWTALAEGGQVMMPLERQAWGADYGMLADRFGILWHINISAPNA